MITEMKLNLKIDGNPIGCVESVTLPRSKDFDLEIIQALYLQRLNPFFVNPKVGVKLIAGRYTVAIEVKTQQGKTWNKMIIHLDLPKTRDVASEVVALVETILSGLH